MTARSGMLRFVAAVLCVAFCMMPALAVAAGKEKISPYPDALQITIRRESLALEGGLVCESALPVTCREDVNQALEAAHRELLTDLAAHATEGQSLELEATYRISGTCWAGYLLIGRIYEKTYESTRVMKTETTTYLNHRVLTYNMETGQALTLADVFPEDSPAWDEIAALMRNDLLSCYPDLAKDEAVITELCAVGSLRGYAFLPSAGRLLISTPLTRLHEAHWQLVNTVIPYPDFRSMMAEEAFLQTDNSHRRIIAITYDDGPTGSYTPALLRTLNDYGASASFFCIGSSLEKWPDIARQEHDYGHTVGSHTYEHKYDFEVSESYLRQDREKCMQLHCRWTGFTPTLLRAPGGGTKGYLKYQIGWPIILWRLDTEDTGDKTAYQIGRRIQQLARDGDIVLMHDIFPKTVRGTEVCFTFLKKEGYLYATVDELMYLHGITPEPDTVYSDLFETPKTAAPEK